MNLEQAIERSRARRRLPSPEQRRALRERAGISQAEVASALGVHRITVTRWETGQRVPGDEKLEAYVQLLDRLAAEVMTG
jgi:transcriptional regulator with XRE-family HTH domain